MGIHRDAFGGVTFVSFIADCGQHSTPCAMVEELLDTCSEVTVRSFDADGGQHLTACAKHERLICSVV